jgi:hypothetical protein
MKTEEGPGTLVSWQGHLLIEIYEEDSEGRRAEVVSREWVLGQ